MSDILLIETSGRQYGIWKDEIISVREAGTLHRLPLSPACIAGIAIIDGATVTLADLPVCIGLAPASEDGKRRVLLPSSGDKTTGFMVGGEMESLSLPPEEVLPMPGYLKTDLISSCIVRSGVLVPIINLSMLYRQLLRADQEPFRASFTVAREPERTLSVVRLFRIGNEVFGALSAGGEEDSAPAGRITELSLVPQFVRGITLHRGQVLPVIDLCQRIRRQKIQDQGRLMIHEAGSDRFGLLVDEFRGSLAFSETVFTDLPPIARSPWLRSAMLQDGTVVPLVGIGSLLTVQTEAPDDKPLPLRYSLDSPFHSVFNTQPVDVVEFSLLGARHALPKSEVEDVLPFARVRSIPETPEIVIGVTEHNGSLLPVLDLAMVFGRRSLVNKDWKMMLVKNGDFRAFVITESAFGARRLPLEVQRTLPIVLPHRVVYGCYPDADAVRLILNVGAIALHFEKSLVKELLPALSPEMKLAPAEIVASLLGEEAATAFAEEAAVSAASSREEVPAGTAAFDSSQATIKTTSTVAFQSNVEEQLEQDLKQEEVIDQIEKPDLVAAAMRPLETQEQALPSLPETVTSPAAAEPDQADKAQTGEVCPVGEGIGPVSEEVAGKEIPTPEEPLQGQVIPGPAETIRETRAEEKSGEAAAEQEQAELTQEPVPPARSQPEPELVYAQELVPEPQAESKPLSPAVPGSAPEPEQAPAPQAEPKYQLDQRSEPERQRHYHSPWRPEPIRETHKTPAAFTQPDYEPQSGRSRLSPEISIERTASTGKRKLGYAGIAALLAVVVFLLLPFENAKNGKPGETVPEKVEQARVEPVKVEAAKPKQVSVETKAQIPVQKTEPPLVLEIPRDRPVQIDVYVVVKDDTLWSISERFTGNPFNYPRIAGENRIADPDLIFPGQRIRLKKK